MNRVGQASNRMFQISNYVEPDILTTYEFRKTYQRREYLAPERKLMFAVLVDAIECYQKYVDAKSRRHRKIFYEVESWIESRDEGSIYSFEQLCDVLCLDPSYLRRGLVAWRRERGGAGVRERRCREPLRYSTRLRQTRITVG